MNYWVISDEMLKSALLRVSEGEDPYVMMIELFANSEPDERTR